MMAVRHDMPLCYVIRHACPASTVASWHDVMHKQDFVMPSGHVTCTHAIHHLRTLILWAGKLWSVPVGEGWIRGSVYHHGATARLLTGVACPLQEIFTLQGHQDWVRSVAFQLQPAAARGAAGAPLPTRTPSWLIPSMAWQCDGPMAFPSATQNDHPFSGIIIYQSPHTSMTLRPLKRRPSAIRLRHPFTSMTPQPLGGITIFFTQHPPPQRSSPVLPLVPQARTSCWPAARRTGTSACGTPRPLPRRAQTPLSPAATTSWPTSLGETSHGEWRWALSCRRR